MKSVTVTAFINTVINRSVENWINFFQIRKLPFKNHPLFDSFKGWNKIFVPHPI